MPGVASPDGADAASTAALLRSTGDPQQVNSTQVEESIKNNYVRMPDGSSMSIGQLTAPHYDYGDDPGFGGLVKKFAPTLAGGLMSIAGVPWYARLAASAAMGNKG